MKLQLPEIKANYITDAQGNKKFIVLEIQQFEKLIEALEDCYDIAQAALSKAKEEEIYTLEEVKEIINKREFIRS